jgi:predicted nucleotide-binding protein
MFEQPIKGDIDRTLSAMTHEARQRLMIEKNRIMAEAAMAGTIESNRIIVTVASFADQNHDASMKQATPLLLAFIERLQLPPAEMTSWARPQLENLGNALLGEIPSHGFPADHKRIVAQYRAVFQERLDGVLRDIEIGFVEGPGFAQAAQMESKEEWITAANALALLEPALTTYSAKMAICKRAYRGLIRARAERFIIDNKSRDNVEIPNQFWWAEGNEALKQDWRAGDFDTWTDLSRVSGNPHLSGGKVHMEAFGVSFLRADIERMIPEDMPARPSPAPAGSGRPSRKVFLVHGRDDAAKNEVALFLRKIGLEDIILHERPNGGRHLLTKFREEADGAVFAVILMTPDDEGCFVGGTSRPRARQNVVFELGFFIGKLGPANVAALVKGDVEKPSDFDGIAYIALDPAGNWKKELARELNHAKVPFDPAKVLTA